MVTAALEAAGDGKFPWQMAQSVETVSEIEKEEPPKELEPIFTAQAQTKPVATPQPPKEKTYSFQQVEDSYFNDALFIGDSRTVGLGEYSGLDGATFYASLGLNVYDVMDDPWVEVDGKKITLKEALKSKDFKKIYLMLGINEIGTGTAEKFAKKYKEVVDELQVLQPNATIYIQGIIYVSEKKMNENPVFSNWIVNERNTELRKIADNKNVFYLNINEVYQTEQEHLNPEYTSDGVHIKAVYYNKWVDYLKSHGIVK